MHFCKKKDRKIEYVEKIRNEEQDDRFKSKYRNYYIKCKQNKISH